MHDVNSSSIRMSIIVPVSGVSDSIEECTRCLDAQTAPKESFEAIVVGNFSHHESLGRWQRVAEARPFIKLLPLNDSSICVARNAGIESARGDYMMFFDPADSISPNAIDSLVGLFDSLGDSTDVIAYRLLPDHAKIEKKKHTHERWLAKSGLYPLDENPHIAQTAINVCVRNLGADSILFDSSLHRSAEQVYVTENLARTASIGYCREAECTLAGDSSTTTATPENPFLAHEDMMGLFERLLAIAGENPSMERYAHSLLLWNANQNMTSSKLLAKHLSGASREEADSHLARILSSIPYEDYIDNPHLDAFRKGFLLKEFKFPDAEIRVRHSDKNSTVIFDDEHEWATSRPSITVERCLYHGSTLRMRGRLVGPSLLFEEKPSLTITCGNTGLKVELTPSSFCYTSKKMPMCIAKAWSFSGTFNLNGVGKGTPIRFTATIDSAEIPLLKPTLNPGVHNYRLINKTRCFPGLEIDVRDSELMLFPRSSLEQRKTSLNAARHNRELSKARRNISSYCKKNAGKRLWMYVDLPSSRAEGNALVAMLHDLRENDGIERYYISEFEEDLAKAHPSLAGKVVKPDSFEHRCLSLRSEIVICSYLERATFSPFTFHEYTDFADFAIDQRRIYVQHGILHAKIPWYFSFDRLHIDAEAISTTMEDRSLRGTYGFPEDAIISSGAPRLDQIAYDSVRENRKILIVPSWRSYLVGGNARRREATDDALASSSFYKGLMGFVDLITQSGLLEEHGYSLEIKLHPNFKCYEHMFKFESPSISLAPDNIDEQDYPIVVTDFSSYVYDFIYAGANIVYFLPDHVEFAAGLNHYSELEVPLDQAYGPYCESPDELLREIERRVTDTADTSLYRQRAESLFLHTDGKNCDRLYDALKSMADALHENR